MHTQRSSVKKYLAILIGCLFISAISFAQAQGDTALPPKDTATRLVQPVKPKKDSAVRKVVTVPKKVDSIGRAKDSARIAAGRDLVRKDTIRRDTVRRDTAAIFRVTAAQLKAIEAFQQVLKGHPYYNFFGRPMVITGNEWHRKDEDDLFYFLAGLLFYFALIKVFFSKYVDNIMTLFFRVTMRQQQIRDQLLQTPLASLLLNILFVVNGGVFLGFVAKRYGIAPTDNDWLLRGYCSALLIAIYLGKFILLKITGWVFNVSHATDTYIFVVFLVNKMIGIFLLPVLVLMAFPYPPLYTVVLTLAYIMLALFLVYRFIISYKPIRNEIKVSRLHFFLYLCAFEIAPLLLIYKVLLIFVERSH